MNINSIIPVSISRQTAVVSLPGFGIPLIGGPNGPGAVDAIRTYTSITAFTVDYASSTAEWKMANAIFAQNPQVKSVKAFKTATAVAEVVTITPTAVDLAVYNVTVNGVLYSFTAGSSTTATLIVTGLKTAINMQSIVGATGSTTLILTAANAGQAFTYAVGANLAAVLTTPNTGLATDIAAVATDFSWYMLLLTVTDSVSLTEAAANIQSLQRLFLTRTNDANALTSATTDIASLLMAANYTRSAVIYHNVSSEYADAAWAGAVLPATPGTETWALKTLVGITADSLNDTQIGFLNGKNCNYYTTVVPENLTITESGKVASGEWIDTMRGIDYLQANIQADFLQTLYNLSQTQVGGLSKVPLTDGGIAIFEGRLHAQLDAVTLPRGGLFSSYTASAPLASQLTTNDKANRTIGGGGFKFTGILAGAAQLIQVNGVVTY